MKINEFGEPYNRSGFAGNLDTSGARGGNGPHRKTVQRSKGSSAKNDQGFPYDKGTKVNIEFGGMNDMNRQSHHPITPKNTEHSVWDDLEEVAGSPILLKKQPGPGSATGVPGAGSSLGWNKNPIKQWDKNDEVDEGGFMYGASGFADTTDSSPEITPTAGVSVNKDKELDIAEPTNRGYKKDIYVVGTDRPFSTGLGNAFRGSRGLYGMMPKESAWDWLEKEFS
jgi:hypothetical protein